MEQNELDKLYDSKIKAIEEFFQDEKKDINEYVFDIYDYGVMKDNTYKSVMEVYKEEIKNSEFPEKIKIRAYLFNGDAEIIDGQMF
ncbi:hypothetical protein [Gemelliphila asaccharolytica]|jgi:hypothetical protein|uniref:Uncharacterized protein n=1 Tax=Gemelliphila asaccharolytica TaxID=502393 RepID=A0ABR5TMA5_9BACL|nr:hypothetical protein [Gemella asaccharolytica]KXB58426.1 hypothetical protein HMPREF1871_00504 [Gemella asaccharolytica]